MNLARILTPSRVSLYCAVLLATNLSLLLITTLRDRSYEAGADFQVFYNAGIILNTQPSHLYDLRLQNELYEAHTGDKIGALPILYPPFFVIAGAILARLPFTYAYLVWVAVSILLLCAGFSLVWRSLSLPDEWRRASLLAALTFPPFGFYVIRGGQASAFGFFALALAYYLSRSQRNLLEGLAMSLLLYKPPLLLFLLPMFVITRQWKTLAGFTFGGLGLLLVSLVMVGPSGVLAYLKALAIFNNALNQPVDIIPTYKFVDLGAAYRLITGQPFGIVLRVLAILIVSPFLYRTWRNLGSQPSSWAIAICATLLVGTYAPIYDCTLLILVALWIQPSRTWMVITFLLCAITEPLARLTGVQVFTFALAFGLCSLIRSSLPHSDIRETVIQTLGGVRSRLDL